jgi:hypothetical protein
LAVASALGKIVQATGQKLPSYVQTEGYALSSSTAHLNDVQDDLEDAVRRLPEPVLSIGLKYETTIVARVNSEPLYRIRFDVVKGASRYSPRLDAKAVSVHLEIQGQTHLKRLG